MIETTQESQMKAMSMNRRLRLFGTAAALALAALIPAACSGGGGGGSSGGELQIVAVNLPQNFSGWELNRAIRVTFNKKVAPSTVNTNTVNVREPSGIPAFGTASVDPSDPKTVIWRPDCPELDNLSDAGLQPNRVYELSLIGASSNSAFTIQAKDGSVLERSDTRTFTTPNSTLFSDLFVDDAVGPPVPVVRNAGSTLVDATYLLVNGVRHYFELQGNGSTVLNPPLALPLNLLSDPSTQVELYVQFNQSVDMQSSNINSSRISWEFLENPGLSVWTPMTSTVELVTNCVDSGAVVRLTPEGLLPANANLRVVVAPEFRDIVAEENLLAQDQFAPMTTRALPGLTGLADAYLEEFNTSEEEDASAPFAEPHAEWARGGELGAKFSFTGTGGPGSDFDWKISAGEVVFLNSINTTIQGGPNFSKQNTQTIIGGVVDVRNLTIEAGGVLQCDGPNPIRILASGDVRIEGILDISGTNSPGVNSLNTTNVPESGAPGRCGGGRGGTGSPLTTSSSPRGGNGAGAYNSLDNGGQGGETGWSNSGAVNERRGAGGGGGQFGASILDQTRIGLDGEDGWDNDEAANSSIAGAGPAKGGKLGPSPFLDNDPLNNFFGTQFDTANGQIIMGELKTPWAGAGGGGGGDAAKVKNTETFPQSNFNIAGDEKGAGGGGGGGSLQILALGNIVFGPSGQIVCRGGAGGGGENTIFLNRVGGGSGGGSGGHVILQTASVLDFSQVVGAQAILATGGQGGAGKDDKGGAFRSNTGIKETTPKKDACPDPVACLGPHPGAGGDGSPGLIQLHTSGGVVGSDILLAAGETLSTICSPPPLCELGANPGVGGCYLVPSFGRLSRARSQWIALGNGGFDTGTGNYQDVTFLFDGTDVMTGDVLREPSGTEVAGNPPILTKSSIVAVGRSLTMDASSLVGGANQVYLDSPELLRHFLVELLEVATPTNFQRFDVVSATYDSVTQMLTLNFDPNGPAMETFQAVGQIDAELQPAYFRVVTSGVPDSLPTSTNVSIFLSATTADAFGDPDLTYGMNMDEPLVNFTPDVNDPVTGLNFAGNKDLRFFRFEVLFDIDTGLAGLSPTNPIPALEFFRLGFQY